MHAYQNKFIPNLTFFGDPKREIRTYKNFTQNLDLAKFSRKWQQEVVSREIKRFSGLKSRNKGRLGLRGRF